MLEAIDLALDAVCVRRDDLARVEARDADAVTSDERYVVRRRASDAILERGSADLPVGVRVVARPRSEYLALPATFGLEAEARGE